MVRGAAFLYAQETSVPRAVVRAAEAVLLPNARAAVAAAFLSAQGASVPRAVVRAAEAVLLPNARAVVVAAVFA